MTYHKGFENQPNETHIDALTITGEIPAWLSGTLVRNGPGQFDTNGDSYRHWFDGLAMLHSFTFQDGQVSYANRFLRSGVYNTDTDTGKVNYRGFAVDPCRTLFQRAMSFIVPPDNPNSPNAVVNVTRIADQYIAMTEMPLAVEFDPRTLETLGPFDFDQSIDAQTATAHPHFDFAQGVGYNYMLKFGAESQYQIYAYHGKKRRLVGTLPVKHPAYIHSFATTPRYVVISENGLRLPNLPALLQLAGALRPFIENFEWQADVPSRFIIMDKQTGQVVNTVDADPFFIFHHINAYEEGDQLILDVSGYDDANIVEGLYLDALDRQPPQTTGEFRRYTVPVQGKFASYEVITDEGIELPRINYKRYNGQPYHTAYGVSLTQGKRDFPDQLIRVNVQTGETCLWDEAGAYPGEPVFVPAPGAEDGETGVVLSVVLQGDTSFLLVLDAQSFQEIGRAHVPQHIPFGFHGDFYGDVL